MGRALHRASRRRGGSRVAPSLWPEPQHACPPRYAWNDAHMCGHLGRSACPWSMLMVPPHNSRRTQDTPYPVRMKRTCRAAPLWSLTITDGRGMCQKVHKTHLTPRGIARGRWRIGARVGAQDPFGSSRVRVIAIGLLLLFPAALVVQQLLTGQAPRVSWPVAALRWAGRRVVSAPLLGTPFCPAFCCMTRHKRCNLHHGHMAGEENV